MGAFPAGQGSSYLIKYLGIQHTLTRWVCFSALNPVAHRERAPDGTSKESTMYPILNAFWHLGAFASEYFVQEIVSLSLSLYLSLYINAVLRPLRSWAIARCLYLHRVPQPTVYTFLSWFTASQAG